MPFKKATSIVFSLEDSFRFPKSIVISRRSLTLSSGIKKKIILMIPIKRCECHFYISLPVSGQQVQGSKQSHNNLPEIKDFHNIWSGTPVCQDNCKCLLVFSIRDYVIYGLFLFIFTFYKTKEEKCRICVPLTFPDVLLSSYYYLWVKP